MTTIYMVQRCYTDPESIAYGAFSTREKACEYIAIECAKLPAHERSWPPWDVVDWVLDEELATPEPCAAPKEKP